MKKEIVVFGSGLVDIFVYTEEPEIGKRISYEIGSKIQVKDIVFDIGGGGVNTATTFSKMGLKTFYYGKIGKDDFGKKILESVKKSRVKFIGKMEGRTGYSIILDSKEHDRTILTYKGSNDEIRLSDNEIKNLDAEWIYLSSLIGKSFKSYRKICHLTKSKIAFNPSLYLLKRENIRGILRRTNVLVLNKEEADLIDKNHKNILKFGVEILCVTDGKNPFYCYSREGDYLIYPNRNVKVVERTGAGDAFSSGFIAGIIKTGDIEKSLRIGVANSESVVSHFGAGNKILTYEEALKNSLKNKIRINKVGLR